MRILHTPSFGHVYITNENNETALEQALNMREEHPSPRVLNKTTEGKIGYLFNPGNRYPKTSTFIPTYDSKEDDKVIDWLRKINAKWNLAKTKPRT